MGLAAIHFARAGQQFDFLWYYGLFFAVAAWLQLSWAAAMVLRPTGALLSLGVVGNGLLAALWAVTRTAGLPFGPFPGVALPVGLADAVCTGFEVLIVFVGLSALAAEESAAPPVSLRLGLAGLGAAGAAVVAISTIALAPSSSAEDLAEGAPAAPDVPVEDQQTSSSHVGQDASDAHSGYTDHVIAVDGTSACERADVDHEIGAGHGSRGPVPYIPLNPEERLLFRSQMEGSQAAIAAFPTVRDAEAAGYKRVSNYLPCIATHYIKAAALGNRFDPGEPEIILYDGTSPDSRIVGLSYMQISDNEPEGFAGRNDAWHFHESLCIGSVIVGGENTPDGECARRGGSNVDLGDLWMAHQWAVAGWDSRWGMFSSEHPDLGGVIGDING